MPTNYFQTTQDLNDLSPFILKHPKIPNSILADNLFRKKLYETPKKIPSLLDYHYKKCDEPTEFADHVIELLEVALDESQDVKFLKNGKKSLCSRHRAELPSSEQEKCLFLSDGKDNGGFVVLAS